MLRREIKCSSCSSWVKWDGDLYDKCSSCGSYLKEERILEKEAKDLKLKLEEEKEAARKAAEHPVIRNSKKVVQFVFMAVVGLLVLIAILVLG